MSADILRDDPFCVPSSSSPIFNMRVEYGGLIFLSGMADERGERARYPGDYKAQTTLVLSYIDEQLQKTGASKAHILKVVVYLRNMEEGIGPFSEAWDAWKDPASLPVRTCVEAKMVHLDALVEIDVTAAAPNKPPPLK
ncbi:hypothetical protein CEUSTIGMA_g5781.t1 [Chlamydomonas eustigma]|uniref:Uncharacterized protein n=1 Tax=Chlamydomonas eustigma TaxID=1157962 RepID=A0A250X5Z5_9CHLO|nr:hypothetical protein CEUSTIGMA_g5781.t1 [Chlamydomonas eustigma]|eukprot:GAX78339.1 hypothetical protein CEUSTIGMA_g5781.t1 [Chlamydomonas eustigma]